MVVDTSFQSQPEDHMVDPITLTVGEYAEDIHQYLREAEVSALEQAYRYSWSLWWATILQRGMAVPG